MASLRDNPLKIGTLVNTTLLAVLAGAIAGAYLPPNLLTAQNRSAEGHGAAKPTGSLPNFVSLAKAFGPSLVHISVIQSRQPSQFEQFPEGGAPGADPGKKFFGAPPQTPAPQRGLGSGFIIDADGHILTSYHVVDNAEKVVVKLHDNREFDAKVVGRDAKTDSAIIKIDSSQSLKAAPLGDSSSLEPGEWVIAMGSPFGLDRSLTVGIVSATGRRIGAGPYDDYIQTDASINPGNSGGPLINLQGEVVGINTAIVSQTGSNIGIGFAIPINMIKRILPDLKEAGKVTRGWIGVAMQTITPDIAQPLGLDKSGGALIADVTEGGPAGRAGLQRGDVITTYDGISIENAADLPSLVAQTAVGKQVQINVLRQRRALPLSVTVGELEDTEVVTPRAEKAQLGLTVQTLEPNLAKNLGLTSAYGVLITSVQPGSAAEESGLARGDVILEVNQRPMRTADDFHQALSSAKSNVLVLLRRGNSNLFVGLSVPKATG